MLEVGARAPDFELHDVNGRPVTLASLQERGPVLLGFFKVSCPVCQYTLPFLERLAQTGQLTVIGISQDDASATAAFRNEYGLKFPLLLDRASDGYRVSNAFGITNVPSIFVVDKDNRVSMSFSGFSRADLEEVGRAFHAEIFAEGEQTPAFRPG